MLIKQRRSKVVRFLMWRRLVLVRTGVVLDSVVCSHFCYYSCSCVGRPFPSDYLNATNKDDDDDDKEERHSGVRVCFGRPVSSDSRPVSRVVYASVDDWTSRCRGRVDFGVDDEDFEQQQQLSNNRMNDDDDDDDPAFGGGGRRRRLRADALFRHEVAFALGQMQAKKATIALISVLKNECEHGMTRHECAEALGAIEDDSAVDVLREMQKDEP